MERTLQVMDCAILVISGTDGVQAHTRTLWQLLEGRGVPVFLFINKMDLVGGGSVERAGLLSALRAGLGEGFVDFSGPREALLEEAATASEEALTEYLESGTLSEETLAALIGERALFPCWFGSALKLEGVGEFLQGLERYAPRPAYPRDFGAKVFKIGRDERGASDLLLYYGPLLRYVIAPILPSEQDREECLSEVAMQVWTKIDSYDPQRGRWTTWLTVLARNAACARRARGEAE